MSNPLFPTLATPHQNHKFYSKKRPSSTVGNIFKALVKYNRHLHRKTTKVAILLNQIINKVRDLRTSRTCTFNTEITFNWLCSAQIFKKFSGSRSVHESLNKTETPTAETPVENARECSICLEEYSQARKRLAFSPCGHSSCKQCYKTGHFRRVCPLCRSEIRGTLTLQGIYWNHQVAFCTVLFWNKLKCCNTPVELLN